MIQERDIPVLQPFPAPFTTDPSRKTEAEQLALLYHSHCQEILKLMLYNQDASVKENVEPLLEINKSCLK